MKAVKTILVIEDDIDEQQFFIQALNSISNASLYFVANNGKEALEQLNKTTVLPDLIFSDIQMPIMNGIECLTQIKNNPVVRKIPVVMRTTDTSQAEIVRALGALACLKKHDDMEILCREIQEAIDHDLTKLTTAN